MTEHAVIHDGGHSYTINIGPQVPTFSDNTTEYIIDATEKKDVRRNVGGGTDVDKLKKSDFVFSDERTFPVVTPGDVSDAVSSWGRYKGSKTFEQFKRRLIALAKRKGEKFVSALPDDWKKDMKKSFDADPNLAGYAVKTLGGNRVGGYAMLWGDEENKDLHGEWFTKETKDTKAIFEKMGMLPFIVHHAADDLVKTFVAGRVDVLEEDDVGLWWEAAVADFDAYKQYVKPLLENRMAYTSTGTLPAAKRVKKTGEITRWPIAEVSATWSPAEWRMMNLPINEVKSYFKELGADPDTLEKTQDPPSEEGTEKSQGAVKARLRAVLDLEKAKLSLLTLNTGDC